MTLRPETAFILSSIDTSSIATFPGHLDPCIEEVLYQPEVMAGIVAEPDVISSRVLEGMQTDEAISALASPDVIRSMDVNAREAIAKHIRAAAVPVGEALSDATPIPGVRIPKIESGQPQIPIPFGVKLPEIDLGTNTIEFQEIIPGIKPPKIPMVIPFFEKLPMLPGWTIRDKTGKVLNEGMKLPMVEVPREVFGIKIPEFLPPASLGPEDLGIGDDLPGDEYAGEYLGAGTELDETEYFDETVLGDVYPEDVILAETEGYIEPGPSMMAIEGDMLETELEDVLDAAEGLGLEEEFET